MPKLWSSRSLALSLTLALLSTTAQVVLPSVRAQEPMGLLTVVGKVRLNGQPAATGDIVSSGSTVETAKGSSAVVSLGKLGRVEALPETRMKLRFDDDSISILLDTGSVRVSTAPAVAATITRGTNSGVK
jgi:ferric-dicitrate binding protein FerR (iron transport regulator)